MSLEKLTSSIKDRVGDKAALPNIIKFDFGDDGAITIDGSQEPAVISNDNGDADCTINITISDFEDILTGELNPQMAFMMGKLKVEGDMSIAMQLSAVLG